MAAREISLERLIGKQVLDQDTKKIGRIEEVRAIQQGDEYVISAFLIGRNAALRRFSFMAIGLRLLGVFGATKLPPGYSVPWDKLDLTDLDHPRLRCSCDALEALEDDQ